MPTSNKNIAGIKSRRNRVIQTGKKPVYVRNMFRIESSKSVISINWYTYQTAKNV